MTTTTEVGMQVVCAHRDAKPAGYRVREVGKGNGRADPRWAVYELFTCSCEQRLHRQVGVVRAPDEREAARLCGVAPQAIEAIAAPSRKTPAKAVPLTRWPFPATGHDWKGAP